MKHRIIAHIVLFLGLAYAGRLQAQYNKENLKLFSNKVSYADTLYRISNEQAGTTNTSYSWAFGDKGQKMKQELSIEEQRFTFGNLRLYMISSEPEFVKAHRGLGN